MKFRSLKPSEVECRIGTVGKSGNGLSLLLYKTARVDADVLDETVGAQNWQCDFYDCKGTLFCKVGIAIGGWVADAGGKKFPAQKWVWKADAGAKSNMEAEKGEASDAFKRACFKWGIGRELYTAPFIWIPSDRCRLEQYKGNWTCRDRFAVTQMDVNDGRIRFVEILNASTGQIVYQWKEQNIGA